MNRKCYHPWIACLLLLAPGTSFLPAAESVASATKTLAAADNASSSLSVTAPIKRAGWQQRLTLGPGDLLSVVGVYEQ